MTVIKGIPIIQGISSRQAIWETYRDIPMTENMYDSNGYFKTKIVLTLESFSKFGFNVLTAEEICL